MRGVVAGLGRAEGGHDVDDPGRTAGAGGREATVTGAGPAAGGDPAGGDAAGVGPTAGGADATRSQPAAGGVVVVLPAQLRELAGGAAEVPLDGTPASVRDALTSLRSALPVVHDRLVTEQGELRPHVNVFVGTEDVRHTGGLDTPLAGHEELVVLPSVSGG